MTTQAEGSYTLREIRTASKIGTSMAFLVSLAVHLVLFLHIGSKVIFVGPDVPAFFEPVSAAVLEQLEEEPGISPPIEPGPLEPDMPDNFGSDLGFNTEASAASSFSHLSFTDITALTNTPTVSLPMMNRGVDVGVPGVVPKFNHPAADGGELGRLQEGFIGNVRLKARKFGAILDISYSTHATIGNAVREINEGFPEALLVLAPGCGMVQSNTGGVITGKTFSKNIEDYHYQGKGEPKTYYSAVFLEKLLRGDKDFERLWRRASREERSFVVHADLPETCEIDREGNPKVARTAATHHGFELLVEQGCDVIYWMADFQDHIEPDLARGILRRLKRNDITVVLHDFDGGTELQAGNKATVLAAFPNETGGSIIVGNIR